MLQVGAASSCLELNYIFFVCGFAGILFFSPFLIEIGFSITLLMASSTVKLQGNYIMFQLCLNNNSMLSSVNVIVTFIVIVILFLVHLIDK